jgi:DNA helicase-2/ATP-dependent DNA helicase PcrA
VDADALLDDLTVAQRAAVVSEATPLCVLAGAGSGKTRVLTRRIAYRVASERASADHVLALTFTRKAAGELRTRLTRLGVPAPVAAGTFHGVAFAQLRQWSADRGQRAPVLLQRKSRLLGPLVARRLGEGPSDRRLVIALEAEISWAQARGLPADAYAPAAAAAGRRSAIAPEAVTELFTAYEVEKRRRGVLDLDDLLGRCASLLETDHAFADRQRWRWRHFFVDEYQDLNPAHDRLLRGWLGNRLDLCAVGDPHQSIYGWNGAEPSLLTDFRAQYPTASVLELADNFRSSPEIVAVAGAVLGQRGRPAAAGDPGPLPTVTVYDDGEAEATGLAQRVRRHHLPGAPWSHQAVLARTNGQLDVIAAALEAAGVPCRHRDRRASAADTVLAGLPTAGPARSIVADLRVAVAAAVGEDALLAAQLEGALEAVGEYLDLDPSGTVAGFTGWLRSSATADGPAEGDGVVLSTFHRAKGLEWPIVFLVGLEDGLVPLLSSGGRAALSEERRLLYVAMTRAERELHCSWARRRAVARPGIGVETMERAPSPFLAPVQMVLAALDGERSPLDPRPRLQLLRSRLAPSPDQVLFDTLTRWRATAARAAGVAPAAILRDDTLHAVASTKPITLDALAGLPGFGPISARRWGPLLLDAVSRHAAAG